LRWGERGETYSGVKHEEKEQHAWEKTRIVVGSVMHRVRVRRNEATSRYMHQRVALLVMVMSRDLGSTPEGGPSCWSIRFGQVVPGIY
jgi:hypothetical protein